jgi:hypothetical protein
LVKSVSKDTEAAILRSMHKDPEKRYANFEDFRMALEASRSRLLVKRYG